jgi:nitronate monooxygenase
MLQQGSPMTAATLFSGLRLPLLCAPMSFASSLPLALACCSAGIIGGWQGGNVRTIEEFELYLNSLDHAERKAKDQGRPWGPHAINIPSAIMRDPELGAKKIAMCEKMKVPLLFSSIGDPSELVKRVHGWGGIVIHDVISVKHAQKAIAAGVDGLMVTCAGAGGHSGALTPFAFVPKVRSMFDGIVLAGGGIGNAAGIAGALALGADLAVMGTRFIATKESGAVDGHKQMITEVGMEDIMVSDAMNGIDANWIRQSIARIGWNPDEMPPKRGPMRGAEMPEGVRPWRDVWSAGHSAGLINEVAAAAEVVDRLIAEFDALGIRPDWRERLGKRLGQTYIR